MSEAGFSHAAQELAASWWAAAGRGLLEGSVAFAILVVLWWPLRRRLPPRVVCVLFLLPLVKVAAPWHVPVPAWLDPLALWPAWSAGEQPIAGSLTLHVVDDGVGIEAAGGAPAAPAAAGWREVAFFAWALAAAVLVLRLLAAQIRTHRVVRRAVPIDLARFPVDLDALRRRAGVRRGVQWRASDVVRTPAAGGILRPFVLVPAGLADALPPRQLAFVLLHELAHVRRHDVAIALVQRLVQTIWFFHPAVWLANWLIDQHRELACDQDALARSGASRRECGEAFLSVAAWVGRGSTFAPALATFDATRSLRRRLLQILDPVPSRPGRLLGAVYLLVAAALTLPSARAADGVDFAPTTLVQQDEGQRAQLEELRREIAELQRQHERLLRELGRLQGGESEREKEGARTRVWRTKSAEKGEARKTSDDDAAVEIVEVDGEKGPVVWRALRHGDGGAKHFVLRGEDGAHQGVWVERQEKSEGAPRETGNVRTFTIDGEAIELDGKTLRLPKGKVFRVETGEGGKGLVDVMLDGRAIRLDGGEVRVDVDVDTHDVEVREVEVERDADASDRGAKKKKASKASDRKTKRAQPFVFRGDLLDKVEGGEMRVLELNDVIELDDVTEMDGGVMILEGSDEGGAARFEVRGGNGEGIRWLRASPRGKSEAGGGEAGKGAANRAQRGQVKVLAPRKIV